MATSVATPLERRLGVIAGVNEMTSNSGNGSTRISLQFDLNRKIDAAAREVQAAINASRADLPATLRSNPTYRKANPSDAPVMILALTSQHPQRRARSTTTVSNIVQQQLAQVQGVGDVEIGGGSLPAVRVELLPFALNRYGVATEDVRAAIQATNANRPKGAIEGDGTRLQIYSQANTAERRAQRRRLPRPGRRLAQRRGDPAAGRRRGHRRRRERQHAGPVQRRAGGHRAGHAPAGRQRHRDRRRRARAAADAAGAAAAATSSCRWRPTAPTRSAPRCTRSSSR